MPDITNIVAPRVALVDPKTGLVAREWYRFFQMLFILTGSGANDVSLTDLQGGPPPVSVEDIAVLAGAIQGLLGAPLDAGLTEQVAELTKAVQGLQEAPVVTPSGVTVMTVIATLDFGNTAAGACTDLTVTVPGAVSGDVVCLGVPNASVPANGSFFPWVSAADTVTVRFTNNSAGALDPASGDFRVMVTRF
jgi:hypothetical protein